MKQFTTIEKLDTGILYALELASSVSVLLLAFGLIASMANVLTNGAILTDNLIMTYLMVNCYYQIFPSTITIIHMCELSNLEAH
jgi:hypothetical protein